MSARCWFVLNHFLFVICFFTVSTDRKNVSKGKYVISISLIETLICGRRFLRDTSCYGRCCLDLSSRTGNLQKWVCRSLLVCFFLSRIVEKAPAVVFGSVKKASSSRLKWEQGTLLSPWEKPEAALAGRAREICHCPAKAFECVGMIYGTYHQHQIHHRRRTEADAKNLQDSGVEWVNDPPKYSVTNSKSCHTQSCFFLNPTLTISWNNISPAPSAPIQGCAPFSRAVSLASGRPSV